MDGRGHPELRMSYSAARSTAAALPAVPYAHQNDHPRQNRKMVRAYSRR